MVSGSFTWKYGLRRGVVHDDGFIYNTWKYDLKRGIVHGEQFMEI